VTMGKIVIGIVLLMFIAWLVGGLMRGRTRR
jgi:hypothetical protein